MSAAAKRDRLHAAVRTVVDRFFNAGSSFGAREAVAAVRERIAGLAVTDNEIAQAIDDYACHGTFAGTPTERRRLRLKTMEALNRLAARAADLGVTDADGPVLEAIERKRRGKPKP